MKLIYLAGPIDGMLIEEFSNWRKGLVDILPSEYIQTYSPGRCLNSISLNKKDRLKASYKEHPLAIQQGVMKNDHYMLTNSNLVIANFTAANKASIGTAMECAWAYDRHIPVIIIMDEKRIHDHPMLRETAICIVNTIEEAAKYAEEILLTDVEYKEIQDSRNIVWY